MRRRHAALLLAAGAFALTTVSAAVAFSPAQNAAFAKQLRGSIKPVFAKKAPSLVLGTVTCRLPENGTVVHCIAHFSDPSAKANVAYAIAASLKESGVIKWAASSASCRSASSGKRIAC